MPQLPALQPSPVVKGLDDPSPSSFNHAHLSDSRAAALNTARGAPALLGPESVGPIRGERCSVRAAGAV